MVESGCFVIGDDETYLRRVSEAVEGSIIIIQYKSNVEKYKLSDSVSEFCMKNAGMSN